MAATFDIRGREYNGRYFNNLQGWKIETEPNNTSVPVARPSVIVRLSGLTMTTFPFSQRSADLVFAVRFQDPGDLFSPASRTDL